MGRSSSVAPKPVLVRITFTVTNKAKYMQVLLKVFYLPTEGIREVRFNDDGMVVTLAGKYDIARVCKCLQEFRKHVNLDSFNHVVVEDT